MDNVQAHQGETLDDSTPDPATLSAARCWYYLIRAANPACDGGAYRFDSTGDPRVTDACP